MQPITYTFDELTAHKEKGDFPEAAVKKLRADADAILEKPTLKVVDIKLPRPSGDPHDFISMGPYWWPNPDTPDGLPYVRRDGYVNPEVKTGIGPGGVYCVVKTLALAAVYFPEKAKEYAEYANRQMYDWFINPDSRMSPNAKFAQGIPGRCEGRGTGLISFGQAYVLFNGIGILDTQGLMSGDVLAGVKEWFVEFANWILTHEYGLTIDNSHDNHSSWHDANLLATAVFTDRPALVKKICRSAYDRRVKDLIKPDGSQPSELRRTKALGYSCFNLEALWVVANIAERLGYEKYWGVDEEREACVLKSAIDFIYPYAMNGLRDFPYEELYPEQSLARFAKCVRVVAKRYPEERYFELISKYINPIGEFSLEPML